LHCVIALGFEHLDDDVEDPVAAREVSTSHFAGTLAVE
jgi:hypothetical protein